MTVRIRGLQEVAKALIALGDKAIDGVAEGIEVTLNEAAANAKDRHLARRIELGGGRVKIEPSEGGANRLKNPDGTPRYGTNSGRLTASILPVDVVIKRDAVRGNVKSGGRNSIGSSVAYAEAVEFGTSRSAPHPFMGPAMTHAHEWMVRNEVIEKAMQKHMGLK